MQTTVLGLERQRGKYNGLWITTADSQVETNIGTSVRVGKSELQLMNCWRLSVHTFKSQKFLGDLLIRGTQKYCEIYFQELNQVLRVNTKEKSPHASRAGGGKKPSFKYAREICSSQQGLTSEENN